MKWKRSKKAQQEAKAKDEARKPDSGSGGEGPPTSDALLQRHHRRLSLGDATPEALYRPYVAWTKSPLHGDGLLMVLAIFGLRGEGQD